MNSDPKSLQEHEMLCDDCGQIMDLRKLSDAFKHEHRGLPLDDVLGIVGEPIEEDPDVQ